MIVTKMESPEYHRRRRAALPGRGVEANAVNQEKSFDQYLLEAFQGDVVRDGNRFSGDVSNLQRDNLVRLSQI